MKRAILWVLLSVAAGSCWSADAMPLEQQVATVDAGRYISPTDSSVQRAKRLLASAAKVYRITPTQAADVAAKGKELLTKSGIEVGIMDILDGALIACEGSCSLDQMRNFTAHYATVRQGTGQSHQQAVRGLLILEYVSKTMVQPKAR